MQSGISVSTELHDAFNTFATDASLFCLPVTITSEALTPLSLIPFSTAGAGKDAFYASLPQLASLLEPKTPLYLLLRRRSESTSALVPLTYIPSNAGVRAKTLFASTRSTLVRELGTEKFATTVFATEEEEVHSESAWRERDNENGPDSGAAGSGYSRDDLMGEKERALAAVRRAEEEARSGTPGRDIGIGGTFRRGGATSGASIEARVDEEAKRALRELQPGGIVQLAIDIPTETIKLATAQDNVAVDAVSGLISESSPRYTIYHYPGSETVIFIYTCPSGSSIKERMLYASSRMSAFQLAEGEGLKIAKKIEASTPDEISGERLLEEFNPAQDEGARRGFARPRRPGR
ncbi:hypothetical protein ASPZODRAFT_151596 [Penicilliopsis zonata CBS 506.65]|uniref:Twinfilin n=1 Tax=Penicilliopsis zonata CBS 506.65 TaxID=1073090 RepID=A0A1L9SJ05_9EURO|nr:hypothetical protein ASPZODRAFT_151596 [Penicilliopsis zonata CBS 506.65]OJJ47014.1 hypothetical protein ASPZODRAFT_151596 [Penicilliopsis zonata CBS 506.65]